MGSDVVVGVALSTAAALVWVVSSARLDGIGALLRTLGACLLGLAVAIAVVRAGDHHWKGDAGWAAGLLVVGVACAAVGAAGLAEGGLWSAMVGLATATTGSVLLLRGLWELAAVLIIAVGDVRGEVGLTAVVR